MGQSEANGLNDEFIDSLVERLEPVRPVRLATLCACALLLQTVFVAAAVAWVGVGSAVWARFFQLPFLVCMSVLVASAAASAWLCARQSIPGRYVGGFWKYFLPLLPLALSAVLLIAAPWGADTAQLTSYLSQGMPCTAMLAAIALPAWLISLALLRTLAPLDTLSTGLFASLSALAQSAVVLQLACSQGDAYHLALGHYLPITVLALLAAGVSSALLRGSKFKS